MRNRLFPFPFIKNSSSSIALDLLLIARFRLGDIALSTAISILLQAVLISSVVNRTMNMVMFTLVAQNRAILRRRPFNGRQTLA
ncbi:hypothetical protein DKP76_03880 [Falsochrobactrum shanghaiense]|uniref:Uncharacterized protein n=1 Tax=Falsochrobactrum shanghaiense TaxID=2201899 RepID=A0A316JE05_9HYPH|nr:hypothetical protein DKP76_03880 [Falsochrobactrum shanghaiense]